MGDDTERAGRGGRLGKLALTFVVLGLGLAAALVAVGPPSMRAEIYVQLADGTLKVVSPPDGVYYQACIHPEGTSVIFAGSAGGPPRIWKADLPTGDVRALTPEDSAAFLATYSWDGEEIVFSADYTSPLPSVALRDLSDWRLYRPGTATGERKRDFQLFVMDTDGGALRQVTRGEHRDLRATFSPDGEELAFYSNRVPRHQLWRTRASGDAEPTPVEFASETRWSAFRPWYSADGETLYFFGNPVYRGMPPDERKRLLEVPVAGGPVTSIPWDDAGRSQGPFVDPSGAFLLFHTNRTGRSELYELPLGPGGPNAMRTEARMLTPPGLDLPDDREVMHPTRAKNGALAFDVSYYEGSTVVRALRSLRGKIAWRLQRWFVAAD